MTKEQKIKKIYASVFGGNCFFAGSILPYFVHIFIGDIDGLIEKGPNYFKDWIPILDLWIEKSKPIQDQTDACIEYIYKLIQTKGQKNKSSS